MNSALIGLLAIGVVIAVVRLVVRWLGAPPEGRAAPWRLAVLIAAQPVVAALLYLTLVPAASRSTGTLVVVTHGGTAITGNRVISLPEAPKTPGAERAPDLATAIRRYAPTRLKIVGDGLEPRDRNAARGLPVDFTATSTPSGLVRLDLPGPVAAGASFKVGGRVAGIAQPMVDLIDPAGHRVDTAVPDHNGDFVVTATTRAPGPATFTLRLRTGSQVVESALVPEWTTAVPPLRLLLLAGAPGPEVKYLRRWADNAGMVVHSEVATGGGLAIGDAPLAITPTTLQRFDMAVIDARRWAALGLAERSAMLAAVRGGLGLLIRLDGPLTDPARAALRSVGFTATGGDTAAPLVLPEAKVDTAARLARDGPGSRDAPALPNRDATVPPLTRWSVAANAAAASPLLRDARGATIAPWRAEGMGRIALWPLDDSFRLVLAGHDEIYGEVWRAAFATLGRSKRTAAPRIEQPAWVGQRVTLCGLAPDARVVAPDGGTASLMVDSAGCAAFWPQAAGWHALRQSSQRAAWPFSVETAVALPSVRAEANRLATLQLAAARTAVMTPPVTGPIAGSWLWAVAWLAASGGLWWFERTRFRLQRNRSANAIAAAGARTLPPLMK